MIVSPMSPLSIFADPYALAYVEDLQSSRRPPLPDKTLRLVRVLCFRQEI
jgi:hypothetical protein